MTTAAIIPYRAFSAGCVVAIVDGPLVLADETIIIGHLAQGEKRVVRVIDDAAIAAAVARVVALVTEHRPRVVNVEALEGDSVEAQRGRFVGAALMQALPFAVMVPGAKGELADRLARLLLQDEGPQAVVDLEPIGRATTQPSEEEQRGDPTRRIIPSREEPSATPAVPQAPKQARRTAGIDPGSRHVAVTVLEGAAAPLRYIASLTLNIGRDVPLRAPKVIKRKDGGTFTKTTRHEVTDADRDAMLLAVADFIAAHDVDEAAVETAKFAHTGAGALLLRSNRYGGVIEGALVAAGLPVRSVTSREWRDKARKMAGAGGSDVPNQDAIGRADVVVRGDEAHDQGAIGLRVDREAALRGAVPPAGVSGDHGEGDADGRSGTALSRTWPAAVRALVAGLPISAPDAREHILDAAGAAAWAAIPDEPKPAPAPKGKRPRSPSTSKRRQDAARASAGCPGAPTCRPPEPGKRGSRWVHGDGCAAGVASSAKRAQGMRGNANARKGASE